MTRPAIPAGVWALGAVSLLMDVSSEMIHSLLPLFLVVGLGASATALGIIEGIAEATASIVKIFSGAFSDWLGRRKPPALIGYGLAAASKPLFALAVTPLGVFVARFIDRIGKGIRGAPRDALVADLTPPESRGAAYGLRQSLDTVGALSGPLLAAALMAASGNDFRLVFWIAVVPAIASVLLLAVAVRESPKSEALAAPPPSALLRRIDLTALGGVYWLVILVAVLLSLSRYSEAFLLLRAENLGLALAATPLVLTVMNVVYAATAYPVGRLSDRWGNRAIVIAFGCAAMVAANLVLAVADGIKVAFLGAALWGLHMGLTQGLLAGLVADSAPAHLRGTAFGCFHLATGVALLPASLMAGLAWDWFGAPAAFFLSAALATLALPGIARLGRRR